ncbi:hypothetical protein ABFS82_03G110300 [Erythranthe guttata]|uniref:NAC domain-containing protein n=1 Tax=Erythranthe guttata TaxID=4155 RepID=A0A022Q6J5_ERYGU|nr:PREDICTED: NAC domain-containing protein 45 [Erythranthe guttata]XP_012854905.1 PREDICTED: NAC domain-containing protein 45 [Erythranthe guttata]EYU22848.1 hypothetical protein MIMGU_mgv1a019069mg [Erythranthe guttata]|eukprot:XP_012854904.1 PREDICTED: NAC domain-containing protein 45 [Erythranthe guttata]
MEMESCVPPGFRFHPTEEELVGYYLKRKIDSQKIDLDVITDIDLYRMEPWDIEGRCKLGYEEQNEWYFFSHKDRKYPTGTRTNRATTAGFWKATGRDKAVLSKERIIGMRKTLVFYKGRAPNGRKTDWIMHEYRLQTSEHAPPQEEGWVVCRAFKKPNPSHKQGGWNNNGYYIRNSTGYYNNRPPSYPSTSSSTLMCNYDPALNQESNFLQSPFDSSSISTGFVAINDNSFEGSGGVLANHEENINIEDEKSGFSNEFGDEWKSFDNGVGQPSSSSSYSYTNMPLLLPHINIINDDVDAQNHLSHVLECFHDF